MKYYFFPQSIYTCTVAFADLFNDVSIRVYDRKTNEIVGVKPVPLTLAPKEKIAHTLNATEANDVNPQIDNYLPRISISSPDISFADERMRGKFEKRRLSIEYDVDGKTRSIYTDIQSVPVTYTFEVSLWSKYYVDMTQLLENIAVWFAPEAYVSFKERNFGIEHKARVVMTQSSKNFVYEYGEQDRRVLQWNLTFQMDGVMWKPMELSKEIMCNIISIAGVPCKRTKFYGDKIIAYEPATNSYESILTKNAKIGLFALDEAESYALMTKYWAMANTNMDAPAYQSCVDNNCIAPVDTNTTPISATLTTCGSLYTIDPAGPVSILTQLYSLIASTSASLVEYDRLQDAAMSGSLVTLAYDVSANAFIQATTITYAATSNALIQSQNYTDYQILIVNTQASDQAVQIATISGSLNSLISITGSFQTIENSNTAITQLETNLSSLILEVSGANISQSLQVAELSGSVQALENNVTTNYTPLTITYGASANSFIQSQNYTDYQIAIVNALDNNQASQISSISGQLLNISSITNTVSGYTLLTTTSAISSGLLSQTYAASANALAQATALININTALDSNQATQIASISAANITQQTSINGLTSISGSWTFKSEVAAISASLLGQTFAASANALAQATGLININTALDANQASQIAAISAANISQQTSINNLTNISGSWISKPEAAAISAGLLSLTYAASANALSQATSLINVNTALDANQATQIANISGQLTSLVAITGSFATTSALSNYTHITTTASISGSLNTLISNEVTNRTNADLLLTPLTTTASISGGLNSRLTTVEGNYATKATPVAGTYNNVIVNSQGVVTSGGVVTYTIPSDLNPYTLTTTLVSVSGSLNTLISNEVTNRTNADLLLTPLTTTASISGNLQSQINNLVPYTGATSDVNLGNNKLLTDAIQLDLTPVASPASTKGLISWNADEGTANIGLGEVTLQAGLESLALVYNEEAFTILNGQLVYCSTNNISDNPAVKLAKADSPASSVVFGMATQDISAGGTGFVTTRGKVHDLDTSAYVAGEQLWLSDSVAGGWTADTSGFALSSYKNLIGFVGTSDVSTGYVYITTNNESIANSLSETERNIIAGNSFSTGVYEYTGMTVATSASFTVPPLKGLVVENTGIYATSPELTHIVFAGGTYPVTNILTDIATYVLITKAGVITQQVTYPTPEQRRDNIFLGKIVHTNKTSILTINNTADYDTSSFSALRDMFTPISIMNEGITTYPDGANLSFNKSAGSLYGMGINWTANNKNPNKVTLTGSLPVTFGYYTRTGPYTASTTLITPGFYDVAGTRTAIPAGGDPGANRSTNVRVYQFTTGNVIVQYGQTYYSSLANAVAATQTEEFVKFPAIPGGAVLIGIISVRRTATALNDSAYAKFTPASIFGEATGGTAGLSTTTLQQAYDNSTTPEIVTNSTLDGITFRRGSASDLDDVIQVQSGVGTNVFQVNGLGEVTTASISGNAGNLVAHDINGKLIDAGAKISDYTPLTTTSSISGALNTLISNEVTNRTNADLLLTPLTTTASISGGLNSRLTTVEGNYATKATPVAGTYNNVVVNSQGVVTSGGIVTYAVPSDLNPYALTSTLVSVSGSLNTLISNEVTNRTNADLLLTPLTTTASISGNLHGQITSVSGALNNYTPLTTTSSISASILSTTFATSANALAQATSLININSALDANQATQIANISGQLSSLVSITGSFATTAALSNYTYITTTASISGGLNSRLTTVEGNYATKATPVAGTYNNVVVNSQGIVTSGGIVTYAVPSDLNPYALTSTLAGVSGSLNTLISNEVTNRTNADLLLTPLTTTSSISGSLNTNMLNGFGTTFTYDISGSLESLVTVKGTKTFNYDGSGNLVSISATGEYISKAFGYDIDGNLTTITLG